MVPGPVVSPPRWGLVPAVPVLSVCRPQVHRGAVPSRVQRRPDALRALAGHRLLQAAPRQGNGAAAGPGWALGACGALTAAPCSPLTARAHLPVPGVQPDAALHRGVRGGAAVGAVPGAARFRLQQAVLAGHPLPQGQRQGEEALPGACPRPRPSLAFMHLGVPCSRVLGRFWFPRSLLPMPVT